MLAAAHRWGRLWQRAASCSHKEQREQRREGFGHMCREGYRFNVDVQKHRLSSITVLRLEPHVPRARRP